MPIISWKPLGTFLLDGKWKLSPITTGTYFRLKFLPPIIPFRFALAQVTALGNQLSIFDLCQISSSREWQVLELRPPQSYKPAKSDSGSYQGRKLFTIGG